MKMMNPVYPHQICWAEGITIRNEYFGGNISVFELTTRPVVPDG